MDFVGVTRENRVFSAQIPQPHHQFFLLSLDSQSPAPFLHRHLTAGPLAEQMEAGKKLLKVEFMTNMQVPMEEKSSQSPTTRSGSCTSSWKSTSRG